MILRYAMDGAANFCLCCLVGLSTLLAATAVGYGDAAIEHTAPAVAPTTAPAASSPVAIPVYETISLVKGPVRSAAGNDAAPHSAGSLSIWRVVGSLLVVLGAIFAMRWGGRRLLNLAPAAGSGGAVQVLLRVNVAPRQQLMLVQVGRHMVLVGNCGSQMNSLCQISDPDEVAGLLGQLRQRPGSSATQSFLSMFGRAGAQFDAAPAAGSSVDEPPVDGDGTATPELRHTASELDGLAAKVRTLSGAFKRS